MDLENLVVDALDPRSLGRFWEDLLGTERLTDEPAGYETRYSVAGGPELDLCFQPVAEPSTDPPRLRMTLAEGLAGTSDPEGNEILVASGSGPLVAVAMESADPDRDAVFWSWLTGWRADDRGATRVLRHPSGRGPAVELHPEVAPKGAAKNRMHLDVRLEAGESADDVEAELLERGGRVLAPVWGELPWRSYLDPSGNELCVLPARS